MADKIKDNNAETMSNAADKMLVIEKTTPLEHYICHSVSSGSQRIDDRRSARMLDNHNHHHEFTNNLIDILKGCGAHYDRFKEDKIDEINFSDYSFVITSGGDGTFLKTAAIVESQLMIGANSTYTESNDGSGGGLTVLDSRNLGELKRVFTGDYSIEKWKQLYVEINGKRIEDLAVNDLYIGHKTGYKSSYLDVETSSESESFVSSGAILSTGMGSHAWFRSAGGTQFGNKLDIYGLIMREPFEKREKYKFTSKIFASDETVKIYPGRSDYIVVFDSKDKEYPINIGDCVKIGLSEKGINVVKFD